MVSLAPAALVEDDQLSSAQSLKQLNKEVEEDFDFEQPNTHDVKDEVDETETVNEPIQEAIETVSEAKEQETNAEPEEAEEPVKDEFEGFYDNVAEEEIAEEVAEEEVENVKDKVDDDAKDKVDIEEKDEKQQEAAPKEIIIERQNSFKSTKKFFQVRSKLQMLDSILTLKVLKI